MEVSPRSNDVWKMIWNMYIPHKLKIFTWLFFQCRLLTNVNRARRHLTLDPSCPHCPGKPKTMLHLFRVCPKASVIWSAIGDPITMQQTFNLDWDAWIAANVFQKNCRFLNHNWSQWFVFIC